MIMRIKMIICYILIFFIPVGSAGTVNNVWVAGYSSFAGSNEPVPFENYIIKTRILDSTRAAVTVYEGQNQIETGDFNVNDFKIYDDIKITLLGIKGNYSWISISKLENKDIWRPLSRARLKWGETHTIEGYTFNVDTFGNGSVNLVISNRSMNETDVFSTESFKDYGNLRLSVRDINRTGFVDLEFFTSKVPEIRAELLTDKDEYLPGEPIEVTIKTMSELSQNIVGVTLESSPSTEILPESFTATGVNGTMAFKSQITHSLSNTTVTIRAKIETRDYYANAYAMTLSKDIFITPDVSIIKHAPADSDDENVSVQLHIHNSGMDNKSIHVHDTVPEELGMRELDWDIDLGPKTSGTLAYYIS